MFPLERRKTRVLMIKGQLRPGRGRTRVRWEAVERLPIWLHEAERAIVQHLNGDATLVHEAVVAPAEQDEIRGLRLAALRPVLHMMGIDEARVRAPRKAAAAIARLQCPAQRGRNAARPPADVERLAVLVLEQVNDCAVAGEPTRGFGRQRRPVLDLAASGGAVAERGRIHVHDDLLALAAAEALPLPTVRVVHDDARCAEEGSAEFARHASETCTAARAGTRRPPCRRQRAPLHAEVERSRCSRSRATPSTDRTSPSPNAICIH